MKAFERALGRWVDESLCDSVPTFNDLPGEFVAEATRLAAQNAGLAALFLDFLVRRSNYDFACQFAREVCQQKSVTASEWGWRDVLCALAVHIPDLLVQDRDVLIAPFGVLDGERWLRMPLLPERGTSRWVVAPCILMRDQPYWWMPGDELTTLTLSIGPPPEPVPDFDVAWRRWLASEVGIELRRAGAVDGATSVAAAVGKLGIAVEALSDDARIAVAGLLQTEWATDESVPPGFHGPDSLYLTRR